MEELIKMKLHEQKTILNGQFCITRVPGGWIYDREEATVDISNPVFIPIASDPDLMIDKFVH